MAWGHDSAFGLQLTTAPVLVSVGCRDLRHLFLSCGSSSTCCVCLSSRGLDGLPFHPGVIGLMNCSSAGLDIVAKMVLQGSSLSSCFCSRLVILGCLLCSLTFSSSSDESALLSDSVGSLVVFSTSRLRCGLVRYARWELWCFGPKPMGSDPSLCLDTLTMLLSSSSINVAIASKWRFCAVAVVVGSSVYSCTV